MQAKKEQNMRAITDDVSNLDVDREMVVTALFESFMRMDLVRYQLSQLDFSIAERVKKEIVDTEKKLNKIKNTKGKTEEKERLNTTLVQKKKWLSDVNEAEGTNFLASWATMFNGYRVDLVIDQNEHVRRQGLVVKEASTEFARLLSLIIPQNMQLEDTTYNGWDLRKFKNTLNRFHQSMKTIVIEDKNEITLKRINKLFSGNDVTIEHNCVGHAIYTHIYHEKSQLVIVHCNRGNGQRTTHNLIYRINGADLDLNKLKTAIETITGLEVVQEGYKKFYAQYDQTLKNLGFSFSWGKHVKPQKIGNCVLGNLKGLLKERLPEDVYKWCSTELRDLSTMQHLIHPMLESGKKLNCKQYNIDTDDAFFHVRQLINFIFDKSVEGIVNGYYGNTRKSEALKKAFKALANFENIINEKQALSRKDRATIKNYIHVKIDLYKKIILTPELRRAKVFYQVLWNEAENLLLSPEANSKEFLKHLISKALINPNFFGEIYDYFYRGKREYRGAVLELVFRLAHKIIVNDPVLNDLENIAVYQNSLKRILLNACARRPCDHELITIIVNTHLPHINPTLYMEAFIMLNQRKSDEYNYAMLQLFIKK